MPLATPSPNARPGRVCARRALAALALVTLALPGVAKARSFSANSLIIPVQIEYQEDDAIIAAYGLVYTILLKNAERVADGERPVTFHWAIAPNKLSQYRCNTNTNAVPAYGTFNDNDGCDFAVQLSTGFPVALLTPTNGEESPFNVYETSYTINGGPTRGPLVAVGSGRTTMKYLGGAWIVDATDRQAFLEMLAEYSTELGQYRDAATTKYVKIHSAKTSFTAPVARVLNQRPPRIAVVETSGAPFLIGVLAASGINAIPNWDAAPPNGVVLERLSAAALLDSDVAGGFPRGRLNELQGSGVTATNRYGLVWFPDGSATAALTADQAANLKYFLEYGTGAYVEANSIDALENTSASRLQTTAGVDGQTPNVAYYEDCNDRLLPGGYYYRSNKAAGQSCFTYGEAAKPYAQAGNFAFEGGQGNYKGFNVTAPGLLPGVDLVLRDGSTVLVSARYKDNDEEKGLVFYMAGHKFENQRYWGQRLIMNSVVTNVPLLLGVELARSEPTGHKNVSVDPPTKRVYQGTYVQLPDALSRDAEIYNPAAPHRWKFPYISGHLYEHDLDDLDPSGNGQSIGDNRNWDAAEEMPAPGDRQIFTFLGGSAHLGWRRVSFFHDQVTASTCADTDADGKCDLAGALAACGTAGVTTDVLKAKTDTSAEAVTQRNRLGMFVQQVRGHCAARDSTGAPNFTPTSDAQCLDNRRQDNLAKLGGIDHGSPAIVGPSRYVTSAPWNTRPVVAYVGARDGMLHAIYVSGSSWTADGKSLPSSIQPGTELWALIPPGQLCGLFSNDAMVDASMNVIDVLADFPSDANNDGVINWAAPASGADDERPTGLRTWRTVLLATTAAGSELFALDVTNPLKPVLLWHVGGATEKDDRWDANKNGAFGDTGDARSDTDPRTYAHLWRDTTDSSGLSAENGVTKEKTGRFDFRNLGLTYGTAVGKIWEGNAHRYVAYLATSTADYSTSTPEGYRGIEVFAVDLVTGQKLWQWQRRYARKNSAGNVIADNAIPGRPALADVDADGTVDRIYVGDMEGHLWELDAREGGNLNYLPSTSSTTASPKLYSFPLFGTPQMSASGASDTIRALFTLSGVSAGLAQQPLTSPIGLGRFTEVPSTPATLDDHLLNRLAIIQGTMGVSWSIAPYQAGQVVILPVFWEHDSRIAYWDEKTPVNLSATRNPRMYGVLDDDAVWTIALGVGERVFGMPRILNNRVVFSTAIGAFHGDISETLQDAGNLYVVHGDTKTTDSIGTKAFGGVLVFENKLVITTATSIRVEDAPTGSTSGGTAQRPFNRATPAIFKTWEQPHAVEVKK